MQHLQAYGCIPGRHLWEENQSRCRSLSGRQQQAMGTSCRPKGMINDQPAIYVSNYYVWFVGFWADFERLFAGSRIFAYHWTCVLYLGSCQIDFGGYFPCHPGKSCCQRSDHLRNRCQPYWCTVLVSFLQMEWVSESLSEQTDLGYVNVLNAHKWYGDPAWRVANHQAIFKSVGIEPVDYPYYDPKTIGLDFNGFIGALQNAPNRSVFLLHACAHNPTGVDPTEEQWKAIADVMLAKNHFAFFDCAYQGFASGDLDRDAWAVRHFVGKGVALLVCQVWSSLD